MRSDEFMYRNQNVYLLLGLIPSSQVDTSVPGHASLLSGADLNVMINLMIAFWPLTGLCCAPADCRIHFDR